MRLLPGMGQIPDYMYYRKLKQWTAGRVAPPGIMFEFRDIVGPDFYSSPERSTA